MNFFSKRVVWFIVITVVFTIHVTRGIFFKEITSILGKYSIVYFSILYYFWLVLLTSICMATLNYTFRKIHLITHNDSRESKETLYRWLGQDSVSEKFLIDLFNNKQASKKLDVIDNLINIKVVLENKLKDELVNYYLFKNYLEFKQKNNSYKKINIILSTLIVTSASLVLSSVFKPKVLEYANEFNLNNFFNNETYSYFIIFMGVAVSVYLFLGSIISSFTENKRRINYLISILDILIVEKENKNN